VTTVIEKAVEDRDRKALERLPRGARHHAGELGKIIVGQADVVDQLLMAIFSRGTACWSASRPAKTLLVSTLSRILSLDFKRIQFTPDLMPPTSPGTEIIQEDPGTGSAASVPARADLRQHLPGRRDQPHAAQDPGGAAGGDAGAPGHGGGLTTAGRAVLRAGHAEPDRAGGHVPLPEAQLDRFMFMVRVDYPSMDEELEIMRRTTSSIRQEVTNVMTAVEILWLQEFLRDIPVPPHVFDVRLALVRATRAHQHGRQIDPRCSRVRDGRTWTPGRESTRGGSTMIMGRERGRVQSANFPTAATCRFAIAAPAARHRIITTIRPRRSFIRPVHQKLVARRADAPSGGGRAGRDGYRNSHAS
jgi:MoxR-like ATPase